VQADVLSECWHWVEARRLWESVYSEPLRLSDAQRRPAATAADASGGGAAAAASSADDELVARVLAAARSLATATCAVSVAELRRQVGGGRDAVQRAVEKLVESSALYQVEGDQYRPSSLF